MLDPGALFAPAAGWWARTMVLSMIRHSKSGSSDMASAAEMPSAPTGLAQLPGAQPFGQLLVFQGIGRAGAAPDQSPLTERIQGVLRLAGRHLAADLRRVGGQRGRGEGHEVGAGRRNAAEYRALERVQPGELALELFPGAAPEGDRAVLQRLL